MALEGPAPRLFVATKAFINHEGKILVVRESSQYRDGTNAGLFDIVGGRVTPGERFDACLRREVKEETGLDVELGKPFFVDEWRPVVRGEPYQVVAIFFDCTAERDTVVLSEDHDAYKWIDPVQHRAENLIPNLASVFEAYCARPGRD